jgi:hypothetical protein
VVVEGDDPVCGRRDAGKRVRGPLDLGVAQPPGLVSPGADRVQPDDDERVGAVRRLGRLPLPLELLPRVREPLRERVRDVVVARDCQERELEAAEKRRSALVL